MLSFLRFKKKDMNKEKFQISNFKFQIILLIFLAWRAVDNWILFFSTKIIPYLGFFPYPREIFDFGLPQVTSALANFDGIHYLKIAARGYGQWEQAFFPLYPLLIKLFTFVFKNELIAGLIISNLSFLIGLIIFFKLFNFKWLLFFILMFPTSFFFGAVYTEGLFFLLFVLTLYFLKKENYWLVSLFAILASLTRLVGVFLVIPIIFLIQKSKVKSQNYSSKVKINKYSILNNKYFMLILSPLIGLATYCLYLWKTTGDPFFFLSSQPVFGANRSTHLILLPQVIWRYLKIFITASHNFQYYVSVFEFFIFIFVFFILVLDLFKNLKIKNWKLIRNFDRLGLNLFSFANLLLPTLTGTFSSIPRYALFSLSFFIFLAEVKNKWVKIGIIIMFLILHIVTLGLFGQGYFIS